MAKADEILGKYTENRMSEMKKKIEKFFNLKYL